MKINKKTVWIDCFYHEEDDEINTGTIHSEEPTNWYKASMGDSYLGTFPVTIEWIDQS